MAFQGLTPPSSLTQNTTPSILGPYNPSASFISFTPPSASTTTWYADFGATNHITNNLANLSIPSPYQGNESITVANGQHMPTFQTGNSTLFSSTSSFQFYDILHTANLSHNLLSVHQFVTDNNCHIIFTLSSCIVKDNNTRTTLYQGPIEGHLYPIKLSTSPSPLTCFSSQVSSTLCHQRLGHPNNQVLMQVISSKQPLTTPTSATSSFCSSCQLGKRSKLPFSKSSCTTHSPLELIHFDLWGSSPAASISGFKYCIIFIDDWSPFSWLYPLHNKSDALHALKNFKTYVENLLDKKIKTLQCDNGGEYTSLAFKTFLSNHGIFQWFSCPYTPKQNGLAERKHYHILELTRTLLAQSYLPLQFWVEAVQTTVYLINRIPSSVLHKISSLQKLFHSKPDYSFMCVYGCACYPWLKPYAPHKLAFRSQPCVFIGYGLTHKGYRCYNPVTGRVYISRHVIFYESSFPFHNNFPLSQSFSNPTVSNTPTLLPLPTL